MKFEDWARSGKNYRGGDEVEYFEDAHDERGEYIGAKPLPEYSVSPTMKQQGGKPLQNSSQFVSPRNYQNVVVYEPRSPEDVQTLIDYLKRREPAIINLDNIEADVAQRVLDFVSGAIYALNGSVHRVAGNIFLLSPEGVEITVPYEL